MMRGGRIEVGRLFGISLGFDLSWLIVLVLVTWSLATRVFPTMMPELAPITAWFLGAGAALGLFASVLFHEMAHALTARQWGIGTRRITLFILGGVAELEDEPPTPAAEFVIAMAGPAASLIAAVGSLFVAPLVLALGGSIPTSMAIIWVGQMNLVLALFNLVPAFPLDGGRVLRSILWWWRKDLVSATRISSIVGQGFALALIAFGVLRILATGDITAGILLCLVGLFVRDAARHQYRDTAWKQLLHGEPVSGFMRRDPVVVPRHISIDELMRSYVPLHRASSFPVVDDNRLLGLVDTNLAARTPRQEWERQSVGTLTEPCSELNTVAPETDALVALNHMRKGGSGWLLVADGDRLLGTLNLSDLLRGLSREPA